jgi:secondary thiamine-phosphate synthase enzyme
VQSVRLRENCTVITFREYETKTGGRLDAVDITPEVEQLVASCGVAEGSVLVFSPHTTCCVLLAEPGRDTIVALDQAMERIAPSSEYYAHDDLEIRTENLVENEPANAPAHVFHIVAGRASESIPISNGGLVLGAGQRVLFVELDSSRKRRYCIQVIGGDEA